MARVPIVSSGDATPQVNAIYQEFYTRMQFPAAPNFITVQGHSEAATGGIWSLLKHVLLGGVIPRWEKELVIVAISRERNCQYCVAAHTACCTMLGVNAELLTQDVHSIADPRLRASILFAIKSAREPQALTEADFDVLRSYGSSQSRIIELISVSALAVYLNIIADATAVEPDDTLRT